MAQINRTGVIILHDTRIVIREEPEGMVTDEFQRLFKKQVFKRFIQQLNRMGWDVREWEDTEHFKCISHFYRTCQKGDLWGQLELSGRIIQFEMWQNKYNIERSDGQGKYEFNKAERMPFLLRTRMNWVRQRLARYFCNVFSGYEMDEKQSSIRSKKRGPNGLTAMEFIEDRYRDSWHFQGDETTYIISDNNARSADGGTIKHGTRVWFFDLKGRINTGVAYYNINNMWWVATGKYGVQNLAGFDLYISLPEDYRRKRNEELRRSKLEKQMQAAIKSMDFARADLIKRLLFPPGQKLYLLVHKEAGLYHCPNFRGYTSDSINAGRFTEEEVKGRDNLNYVVAIN